MGKTHTGTSDTGIAKKVYDEKVFRDVVKQSYFNKFMGSGPNSIVQVKTDLQAERGDTIYYNLRMRLSGSGVTEGQILEGNEEKLQLYNDSVVLAQYRHAVRDDGDMTRQRSTYDVSEESDLALKDWGEEKIDALCFEAILNAPTKVFYINGADGVYSAGSAATAKSGITVTATSKLTLDFLQAIGVWGKTGGGRTYIPLRPLKIDGKNHYVALVHPDNMYDLEVSSDWKTSVRYARERGNDNPIFEGAEAITAQGIVIHQHENCTTATDGGGGAIPWSKCVFMGAQAILWAWGRRPKMVEKEFDYENEKGKAWGIIAKAKKPVFNSLDYGSVGIYASRTNISGL